MKSAFLAMLVVAAGALLVVGCGDSADDSNGGGGSLPDDRRIEMAPIDELEMIIRESAPPQYAVRVVSGLPNGCSEFNATEIVSRSGATISIDVTNTMPSDPNVVCTAIYGTHEEIVELGSDLASGTEYTVGVNDKELKFTAQ